MANNSRAPLKPDEARRLAQALRANLLKRKAAQKQDKPQRPPGAKAGE